MIAYRRKKSSDTWHWCMNCTHWPAADYYEVTAPNLPDSGELCDECKEKRDKGECRKTIGGI
jgi:hypothetical protein